MLQYLDELRDSLYVLVARKHYLFFFGCVLDIVNEVDDFAAIWQKAKPLIDEQRWQEVANLLEFQQKDARLWRDVCLEYFGQFAKK